MSQQRSAKTEERYAYIAENLLRAYEKGTGNDWSKNPSKAGKWLRRHVEGYCKSTARQYKAALTFYFEQNDGQEALWEIEQASFAQSPKKGSSTSAKKAKRLSLQDLILLVTSLAKTRGKYDALIGLWLTANYAVGLRPCEWETAELQGDNLVVTNAKSTNGRSHGTTRILNLSEISEAERTAIDSFIRELPRLVHDVGGFPILLHRCQDRLSNVTRRIWPKRKSLPTLYSTRHQLVADMKKGGKDLDEIAAIFGHATDKTATEHYGRKAQGNGRGGRLVKAAEGDIGRIRKRYKDRSGSRQHPSG